MWALQSTYLYVNCHGRSAKMLRQPRVSTPLELSVPQKSYTKVSSVERSSTINSGISLDCSSNTTLATTASPFNSQTALIVEKKSPSAGNTAATPVNHYYEQNLRNTHQKALHGSRIYDPLDKDLDHGYKQLQPLLAGEQTPYTVVKGSTMSSQDVKSPKDQISHEKLHDEFQREPKQSLRVGSQVLAALSVSLGSMVVGYASAYTSPALVSMRDNATATFEVTDHTGSVHDYSVSFRLERCKQGDTLAPRRLCHFVPRCPECL